MPSSRIIDARPGDLGGVLPYEDGRFEIVVSKQVIEHVYDTDHLLAEAHRVLKPGGMMVTSTENLASWHNVGALMLGRQPFALVNISSEGSVGNPLGTQVVSFPTTCPRVATRPGSIAGSSRHGN